MTMSQAGSLNFLLLLSFQFTTSVISKISRCVLSNEWEILKEVIIIKYCILKKILQIALLNKHSSYIGFEKDMINENILEIIV